MTLKEYCERLSWTQAELARQAGITTKTAGKAWNGEPISARTAREIADALSRALGERVFAGEIDGLVIQ